MTHPFIGRGNHGQAVTNLQRALGIEADGDFGRDTENAVRHFQRRHRLDIDGVVGTQTWTKLQSLGLLSNHPAPSVAASLPLETVASVKGLGQRIAAVASREQGNRESGGDNAGPSVARYKQATDGTMGAAWCSDFASYIAEKIAPGLVEPTSVAKGLLQQFKDHGAFKSDTRYRPQPGDMIFFDTGTKDARWKGHVGFVTGIDRAGNVHTVEGNKSHPVYKDRVEGIDYHYNAALPDGVRKVVYSPAELEKKRHLGYGSVAALVENTDYSLPLMQGSLPQRAGAPNGRKIL